MNIRKAIPSDARSICDIYNYYVVNTAVSFETEPVSEEDMKQRIGDILDSGYSYARRSVFRYVELEAKLLLCETMTKDY